MRFEELNDEQKRMLRKLKNAPAEKAGKAYDAYDPETIERELRILRDEGWKPGAFILTNHAQWEHAHPAEIVSVGVGRRTAKTRWDDRDRVLVQVRRINSTGGTRVETLIFDSTRTSRVIEGA